MSEQAQPVIQQNNMLVFYDPEDIEYLRRRQARLWNDEQKAIGLPALAQVCVKEARIAEEMGERAEASCSTK